MVRSAVNDRNAIFQTSVGSRNTDSASACVVSPLLTVPLLTCYGAAPIHRGSILPTATTKPSNQVISALRILLAEDEKTIAITLGDELRDSGYEVTVCPDGNDAWSTLQQQSCDILISDMRMPGKTGMELLALVKGKYPEIEVIMITGFGEVQTAVEAMKAGASDYILKPFLNQDILQRIEKIGRIRSLREENSRLKEALQDRYSFDSLIGKSKPMQEIYSLIETVAPGEATILITGETGTGKELISNAIHHNSTRQDRPLIKLNCAVFPETLIESELFGHERGAFTDAKDQKIGRFEKAHGGTIFLDEIDDMPLRTQVKLLRVLQEREIERLGGSDPIKVDIRLVAATKVDLGKHVQDGKFREDLYYRLNVVPISLPPLRDRHGDIPLLVNHFIESYGRGESYEVPAEVLDVMCRYPWPGNVRELENAVERSIAMAGTSRVLKKEHLLRPAFASPVPAIPSLDLRPLKEVATESEMLHIRHVVKHTDGHKARAAEILGISRKNLWEKMKDYELEQK